MSDFEVDVRRSEESQEIEIRLELEASPETVWKALTEGAEIERWFALQASSTPGAGGSIGVSWDGDWESELNIDVWEPDRRLRATWPWPGEDGDANRAEPTILNYYLEARQGGGTILRLVHSGFPVGDGWDDVFDGARRGWSCELQSLKHYVENHFGQARRVVRARRPLGGEDPQKIWDRLWSADGLAVEGSLDPAEGGGRYRARLAAGLELAGKVLVSIPPTDLGATVNVRGSGARGVTENSLLRVMVGHDGGDSVPQEVQLWLATWGSLADQVSTVEAALDEVLDRVL